MIAIDFGTTNSSVAIMSGGDATPRIQSLEYGDTDSYNPNVLASAVCDCKTQDCKQHRYGHDALRHGFEQQHDTNLLHEMKLYFDKSTVDPPTMLETKDVPGVLREEGGVIRPLKRTERFAQYLTEVPLRPEDFVPGTTKLIEEIIHRSGATHEDKNEVIVGLPASFGPKGRRQLREAAKNGAFGKRANYDRIFMYLEPIAAARSYMQISKGNILVLDYGGGTLDISVVTVKNLEKLHENKIAIGGFPEAGSRMDNAIVDYLRSRDEELNDWFNKQPLKGKLRFKRLVEKAKISLSTKQENVIELPGTKFAPIRLAAPDVSHALQPTMTRMAATVTGVVRDAVGALENIDFVVMSGGTSLDKVVQTSVLAMFNHLPEAQFVLPDAKNPESVKTCLCAVAGGLAQLRKDGFEPVTIDEA